jgi:hypothetical protein
VCPDPTDPYPYPHRPVRVVLRLERPCARDARVETVTDRAPRMVVRCHSTLTLHFRLFVRRSV